MEDKNWQDQIKELNRQIKVLNNRHDLLTEDILKQTEEDIARLDLLKKGRITFEDFKNLLEYQKHWIQTMQIIWHTAHPGREKGTSIGTFVLVDKKGKV